MKFLENIYYKHQEIKNSLLKHMLNICCDDDLIDLLEMLKVQDETSTLFLRGQSSVMSMSDVKSTEIIKFNLLRIHKVNILL